MNVENRLLLEPLFNDGFRINFNNLMRIMVLVSQIDCFSSEFRVDTIVYC